MRAYLLIPSLLLLLFAFALPLLIVMGGGNRDAIGNEYDRDQSVNAKNPLERAINRSFYWLADHRPACGVVGVLGLVVSIFWK
jgi:hypothetical protein